MKYRFYFNSDTVYRETPYVNSGEPASLSHIFTTVGSKTVKVKTVDANGVESAAFSPVLNLLLQLDGGGGGEI